MENSKYICHFQALGVEKSIGAAKFAVRQPLLIY